MPESLTLVRFEILFLVHMFVCFFLTGLIWVIQIVHYPSFSWVDRQRFTDFSAFHQRSITYIVLPTMILELTTGAMLLVHVPSSSTFISGMLLIAIIWLSTFFMSIPLHSKLSQGFCQESFNRLVITNWPRTIAWSARSLILCFYFLSHFNGTH